MTTTIIAAVISILSALITRYLVPYIRAKTTAEQREHVVAIVGGLVKAAEQMAQSSKHDLSLAGRKEWVINRAAELGINVSMAELDAIIEAAVLHLSSANLS